MAFDVRATPRSWTWRGEALVPPAATSRTGRPLLAFGGIPGEEADFRVLGQGQHQAHGQFVGTETPSPHRVEPPCEKYMACGGCPIMHVDAVGQADARAEIVRRALDEHGLGDVALAPLVACPDGLTDFRHVVKLGVGVSDRGRIRVGSWGRGSRNVVPIPRCDVAAPVLNRTMVSVAHHVIDMGLYPYDATTGRGVMRAIILRASRTTGEVLVTLVVGRRIHKLRELADRIAEGASDVAGVWVHVNSETGNGIFARDEDGAIGVSPLIGKEWIEEELEGVRYRIGPGDFFQTNPSVASALYARTVERLALHDGVPVVDLYSGVGGFALQAARRTGWALGVEEIEGAVTRAREAARMNGIKAEFVSGRVEDVLPDVKRRLGDSRPVVTVNPARRGLEEGVGEGILSLSPRRIAYISCNPRALARDLAVFRERGFTVDTVEPFDMFPNTAHVECLAILHAPDADDVKARAPRRRVVRRK